MFEKLIEGIVVYSDPFTCVSFNAEVLKQIEKYIQNNPHKNESGGLLLGYRHSNHFEITHITTPKLLDMSNRLSFERKDITHIKILKRLIKKDKNIAYLGEWHTHPEDYPSPSSIDNSQWELCRKNSTESLIFVIFGINDYFVELLE